MIEVKDIAHAYGKTRALDGVSLDVAEGELFGLIGPDGAGKTSLFRILCTLLLPEGGSARVMGLDVVRDYRKIRLQIGYMPGRFSLYQDLTVKENLEFFATIFGTTIRENYHLIKDIYSHLEPFADRQAGALSGGMKQKLALSCALIHKPKVLFLDEPTTGVDPVSRKEFWEMLARLRSEGITIMVSTPYMDEAARCDRIGLLQEGKLLGTDTPAGIAGKYQGQLVAMKSARMYELMLTLRQDSRVASCYSFGENLHVSFDDGQNKWRELARELKENGFDDLKAEPVEAGIENVFMQLLAGT